MTPHVKFRLNRGLDKQMIAELLKYGEKAGFNFAKEVISDHPKLKGKENNREFINSYVDDYYSQNKRMLLGTKKIFQEKWNKVEKDFLELSKRLFGKQPWPKGKYNGYISIIQCGPRFLKTKEFQSSYKWEPNIIPQVIHEMLHFQFYEAVRLSGSKFSEEKIWTLSEVFNDIVQNEKDFVKLQGYKVGISYPDHKKEHQKYKALWHRSDSVKDFIKKAP